jgi:fluoride exporter
MSLATVLGIGVLGGIGAMLRFLLDGAVAGRLRGAFPYGTFAVNISGALLLGLVVGAGVDGGESRLLGTGLLGAFTTFSTWALESHRLGEDGRLALGAVNFAVSLAVGLLAAWLGREIGGAL